MYLIVICRRLRRVEDAEMQRPDQFMFEQQPRYRERRQHRL